MSEQRQSYAHVSLPGLKELFNGKKVAPVESTDELTRLIRVWATERGLDKADPHKQALKLGEEFGELCEGLAKGKREQVIDSIGDMYVVMTILSMQLGLNIEDCIKQAYMEIKDRKGRMVDGIYVKEEDLNE